MNMNGLVDVFLQCLARLHRVSGVSLSLALCECRVWGCRGKSQGKEGEAVSEVLTGTTVAGRIVSQGVN